MSPRLMPGTGLICAATGETLKSAIFYPINLLGVV
jgi:hypothetical protein